VSRLELALLDKTSVSYFSEMTASAPLTMEEEVAMQQEWRTDPNSE
jgi:hypothetical protein